MADTFCILPWKFLWVLPHGGPGVCCKYQGELRDPESTPLSFYRHSLEEIWNSEDMMGIRRAMADGRPVPGCQLCYEEESAQGSSLRTNWNQTWLNSYFSEGKQTAEQLQAKLMADGGWAAPPGHLYLSVGNLCNLKCRMCDGYSSSRIERDPIHGQWASQPTHDPRYVVFSQGEHWFRQSYIVQNELMRHPKQIRFLSLAGGETMLIKEIGDVLQYLIDAEAASEITLELTTSASFVQPRWLPLTERFQGTRIVVSIDGFGKYHEYIRYPLTWDVFTANLEQLRATLPRANFDVSITLQSYNLLNLVELFRYLDAIKLNFYINILDNPLYLRARAMPLLVRRLAAARLRGYARHDCRAEYRQWVRDLADGLESADEPDSREMLRQFHLFTNDLDVSRGQSFRETHAEMVQLLAHDGFKWTDETMYATAPTRVGLPLVGEHG